MFLNYSISALSKENLFEQQASYAFLLEMLGSPSLEATKAFLAEREMAEPEEGLTDELRARIEAKIAAASHPQ